MDFDHNHVTINLDAVEANFDAVCKKSGVTVMAVVKADAYGHGAVPVARLLASKCGFFGVSSLAEALELRYAEIQKDRKSTRLNSSHVALSRMPSSA